MPIRNEGSFISKALAAILAQDYPADKMEVIVVDGMSDDDTRSHVESVQARAANVLLLDNPGRIVPTAMNIGLARATGEIIARVDGHCTIPPDYLKRCVHHLLTHAVDGVGGSVNTVGETWMARVIAAAMSSPFGVGGSAFRTTSGKTMPAETIPFPVFTRSMIELGGPYDEELVRNQDDEYNYRLRKLGARLLLAGDVRTEYYSRSSMKSLWRQYFQYGYWKVRVMQKHPRQMSLRQFIPAAFVTAMLLGLIAALVVPAWTWLLAVVAGAYIFANVSASILTARQQGFSLLPLLPAAYATLHVSYGCGFLVGLVKFRRRWSGRAAAPVRRGVSIA